MSVISTTQFMLTVLIISRYSLLINLIMFPNLISFRDVHIFHLHNISKLCFTMSDTLYGNLFIWALELVTMWREYLESWVNLSPYSSIVILLCLKFMNSWAFDSLYSLGKNISNHLHYSKDFLELSMKLWESPPIYDPKNISKFILIKLRKPSFH